MVPAPRLADAVRDVPGGTALDVEVVPGARASRFPAGFNAWRGRIQARVAAPPEDGRANEELLRLVADFFGAPAAVRLVAGAADRRKTLVVAGLDRAAIMRRLEAALARREAEP